VSLTHSRGQSQAQLRPRSDPLLSELVNALSPDRIRVDSAERSLYAHDASVFVGGVSGPVCFPVTALEVQRVAQICAAHGRSIVPRGAGTGLAGGAIPLGAPVVVVTTKMTKILEVDVENRIAWVEPGVINLDLTRALRPYGFHFAPDPSSQQACTIGGNVANNSGGPHCLAYGVTSHHVLAIDVVLPDGEIITLGGLDAEPDGYDLRGAFVGSEGTLGIATRIAVRITPTPPAVRTLLLAFDSIEDAANTVSGVIAAGIVPAAMEVMDQAITAAVENFVHAGYPLDAAAVLLAEVDGWTRASTSMHSGSRGRSNERGEEHTGRRGRGGEVQTVEGRKTAFGAVAQIAPAYYLHDTVVPRSALAAVLRSVYEIAERHHLIVVNVFHAGDGNLHPCCCSIRVSPVSSIASTKQVERLFWRRSTSGESCRANTASA